MLSLSMLLLACPQASSQIVDQPGKPGDSSGPTPTGLVEIPSGKTHLGLKESVAAKMIKDNPNSAQGLGAQVGDHNPMVATFWISPTEVTNEMYLRFVESTDAMPPASWAQFTREQRLEIIAKLKAEDPAAVFDDKARGIWWEKNWQEGKVKWQLQPEQALLPVGYISHQDAVKYCIWAGLRLPTEEEWVRAARGNHADFAYPFGKTFDANKVAHKATKPRQLAHKTLPAAALPNASPFGIYDLSGNMWEWTDTGFEALPDFKTFDVNTKAGRKDVAPDWDAGTRVMKGGSSFNPGHACSIDTRIGIRTNFRAPILGFRVASTPIPGYNAALYALRNVSGTVLGGLPTSLLNLDGIVALERRTLVPPRDYVEHRAKPKSPLPEGNPPATYAVFDRYDCVTLIPLKSLNVKKGKLARSVADAGPIPFGVVHTTVALEGANVLPGTYILKYIAPLEAETILDLKATLPPKAMEGLEEYQTKELKEGQVPITDLWPKVEGLTIKPDTEYLLLVDNDNNGLGLIPLNHKPENGRGAAYKNDIAINLQKGQIDFTLTMSGTGRDSWAFKFSLMPRSNKGALVYANSWDGDYFRIIEPKEKK
jgi:formylglycine-generating enzyme required for sulfatase activity